MAMCGFQSGCSCCGCCNNVWPTPFHVLIPRNHQGLSTLETISGIGMPGAQVEAEVGNFGVMTTTVAGNGTWSFPVNLALPNGTYSIKVTHRSGNCVETSYITFRVINAPSIPVPVITDPAEGSTIPGPSLMITGTGLPGYMVTLCLTNGACVYAQVDDSGNYMAQYPYLLSAGNYSLTASQRDPLTGAMSSTTTRRFSVGAMA